MGCRLARSGEQYIFLFVSLGLFWAFGEVLILLVHTSLLLVHTNLLLCLLLCLLLRTGHKASDWFLRW